MDFFSEGNEFSTHKWVKPIELLKNFRRKKRAREVDSPPSVISNRDGPSSPLRKQPSIFASVNLDHQRTGRQHSIFTLSSNNVEIAEEQYDMQDVFKSKTGASKRQQANPQKENDETNYHTDLCIDWSLKSYLRISAKSPYQWSTNNLKSSEESSGISAFVRCIDIEPVANSSAPRLDSSLGAQFHQCCLYWQYPHIPSVTLFPRDGYKLTSPTTFTGRLTVLDVDNRRNLSQSGSGGTPSSRLVDEKVLQSMQSEWIDAIRSSFHLLRLRQSPYFYVCAATFTCLFTSAGARDPFEILAFITPSTKGFRDSLTKEGIKFEMPNAVDEKSGNSQTNTLNVDENSSSKAAFDDRGAAKELKVINKAAGKDETGGHDDDEDPEKWLDDMGISQDISISESRKFKKADISTNTKDAKSASLVVIRGSEVFSFFNFLINTRNILLTSSGPFAGIPPTILSLVAFHGATLKWLKVTERKTKSSSGQDYNLIEMTGPILPHVPHMLCGLLSKTVGDYKIHLNTLSSTIPFNHMRTKTGTLESPASQNQPNVFAFESLTDCGLTKPVLDVFCQCNENCSTIKECLMKKDGLFTWY